MFKERLWPLAVMFILFLIQNFLNYLFPQSAPPLSLIGVVYYSLKKGPRFGIFAGLFAGILGEMFARGILGFYMAEMAVVGALSGFASSKVFQDNLLTEIFLPAMITYLAMLAELIFLQIAAGQALSWGFFGQAFRGGVLLWTLGTSPVLFFFLRKDPWRS